MYVCVCLGKPRACVGTGRSIIACYLVKFDDESSQEITKDDTQHKVTGKEPENHGFVPRL